MPAIRTSPTLPGARSPARIVTESINAALKRGLTVSSAPDLGVACTSTYAPAWELDPRAGAISPLGAVLLIVQPKVTEPVAALVHALGVGSMWQEGFSDGCAKEDPRENLEAGPDGLLYADGYRVGGQTRALLHRALGVPVLRDADEITEPLPEPRHMPMRAVPGGLIVQLLGTLTLAEALEAVAESVPTRTWNTDTKADVVEDLRERAAEYRDMGL